MSTQGRWLVNGQAAVLPGPEDRGFAYGDGLFETMALRGGAVRFLDRHLQRLATGCQRLLMAPPAMDELRAEIAEVTQGQRYGTVKIIVTRGSGRRGYLPPADATPTRAIGLFLEPEAAPPDGAGVAVALCATPASSNARLAGLKTLNRLDSVLARAELAGLGAGEGLLVDAAGNVSGATSANLFLVAGGRLLTPDLALAGVRGIMRGVVMERAALLGHPVVESAVSVVQLGQAEEMFLTNALIGLRPVESLAGRVLGTGPVTRAIAAALRDAGVSEAAA